jgi:carboxyl-terminal processing protease
MAGHGMHKTSLPLPTPSDRPARRTNGTGTAAMHGATTANPMNERSPSGRSGPPIRWPFIVALCLVGGMGAGMFFDRWLFGIFAPSGAAADFRLMEQAWNVIQRHYVDRSAVNPKSLTYGAIGGMVDALGDTGHSTFLSPEMVKQLRVLESGQLKGIGVEIQMKGGQVVIVAPMDNSPAQRAGLQSGDVILDVNGKSIAGLHLEEVSQRITGPVGSPVNLTILDHQTHHLRQVVIMRATVKIINVTWQRLPGTEVADLRIAAFGNDTSGEVRRALREIQAQKLRGIILDLRNNPGGELDEAVATASEFLPGGNVLLVKNADGKTVPVPVKPGGVATNLPLAVLINAGSASAAEIVAGSLRDAQRAELIGETTFGTGTVLREFPLFDGSALMLAIQEWLTPSGQSFWHRGIAPELSVGLATNTAPLVPTAERQLTAEALKDSPDKQLLRALTWIEGEIRGHGPR